MLRTISIIIMSAALSGCLFAPEKYGSRGFVGPEQPQYQRYLANCLNFSPKLREVCALRGNPDVIQIGCSAGIFGWREPAYLLRVGSFGRTSEVENIPAKWRAYFSGQLNKKAQLPKRVAEQKAKEPVEPTEPHIQIKTLNYDPNTRKGHITVEFDSGYYAEARLWARENIETLARDKNVALQTGEIPSEAKFYLGAERVKEGNLLEIEFETE